MVSQALRRSIYLTAAGFTTVPAIYLTRRDTWNSKSRQQNQKMLPSYEATFSVPITCESCTSDISNALSKLPGIHKISYSIPSKLVSTQGTEPPSRIISAIQMTGRAAVLRGSGNPNSAAVCILETPPSATPSTSPLSSPVRGLARLIELGDKITLLDLSLSGMQEGQYRASIRASGDISAGQKSLGAPFLGLEGNKNGELGEFLVDANGRGSLIGELDWRVWEMVGRGVLVENVDQTKQETPARETQQSDSLVLGVIARSAGTWENDKSVCSCTGKTVWEEREEMVRRGML